MGLLSEEGGKGMGKVSVPRADTGEDARRSTHRPPSFGARWPRAQASG